ncbi:tubulin polyglutamylase TTLL5 isoform X2 [Denticeps clupeoides]|uniref:tubulin polyglutamylase TTLL5 isoform X2 n=1 Tax=Denticeps clupeoides TaxID=299321 RepID=UPI0010A3A328|nr:tubulin polyglutamylase TTLL5 isoform X2 [Denticeps clupeoides]
MPAVVQDGLDSDSPSEDENEDHLCIAWSGGSRKIPVVVFYAEAIVTKEDVVRSVGELYNLAFKIVRTESRLVRGILSSHGFHEVHPNSNDFNLMWTGSHLKPYLLRSLLEFQKVNHFPRSYELTRKDRLYKNIQRMQQAHGFKNFQFVPQTFVLPAEYQEFCNAFSKDKGPWIIKPVASSRGRGIYLVSSLSQIPLDESILVSRYISNPLLIDDFKFDVRLYVLVTSYDPLVIYLYEEGLARFATVKYNRATKNIKNQFMHLTNYSVNKKSSDYVSCDDPEVEDYGNKWSMSAMLRYLKQEGKDITLLMGQIEDLVVKAVLSAELQIAAACKMFVPHRSNCFELYGFDVLIDSNLKPWLLEVNLSPSLACDAPLDLKIKASLISDMFSLVGIACQDPLPRQSRSDRVSLDPSLKHQTHKMQRPHSAQSALAAVKTRQRPFSAKDSDVEDVQKDVQKTAARPSDATLGLTAEEVKVLRRTREEHQRRGGFIRIFPTLDSWDLYSGYLEFKTTMNSMLANKLFHGRSMKATSTLRTRHKLSDDVALEVLGFHCSHVVQYERKLLTLEALRLQRRHVTRKRAGAPRKVSSDSSEEGEGEEEDGPQTPGLAEKNRSVPGPDEVPAPPKVPKSKVNLLNILQQGWDLSKVQARMAFSSYLHRVQMRLLAESSTNSGSTWPEKDKDQMELVMRFLKRAAGDQQAPPSDQLALQDRRRVLSRQLGEFIHCYNKETEQMVENLERVVGDDRCINPGVFQEFIQQASESELEEVLTFYTNKNKSASVFLGSKSRDCNADHANVHHGKKVPAASEGLCASETSLSAPNKAQKTAQTRTVEDSRNGVNRNNKAPNREHEVQAQGLKPSEAQSGHVFINENQNERQVGKAEVVKTGETHPRTIKVRDFQPSVSKNGKDQPRLLASQHSSSYPAALDCYHIHLQHCCPAEQPYPQPPPYPPPPAPVRNDPQIPAPSLPVSGHQGARVMWASGQPAASNLLPTTEASQRPRSFTNSAMAAVTTSSIPSAVHIYSQKLAQPPSAGQAHHSTQVRFRPSSAGLFKELDSVSSPAPSNQQAIVSALQKLVEKQAARQYATSNHISLLTHHLTNLNLASGVLSRNGVTLSPGARSRPVRALHSHAGPLSATSRKQDGESSLERETRGVAKLMAGDVPQLTSANYQLQFAIRQLQQQRANSKLHLPEQSRGRQQAVLAAHEGVPCSTPLVPRPQAPVNDPQLSHPQAQSTFLQNQAPRVLAPKPPSGLREGSGRKTPAQRLNRSLCVQQTIPPSGIQTQITVSEVPQALAWGPLWK